MNDEQALVAPLRDLATTAGAAIMEIYATPFTVEAKADASPVTAADEAAEAIILAGLARLTPTVPVIAEELSAKGQCPDLNIAGRFWLVDPLDGTREFIARNGEFTVNIGLIDRGRPILGVVFAPAIDEGYVGLVGHGAWRWHQQGALESITVRVASPDGVDVLASRSHRDPETDRFLAGQKLRQIVAAGSSLKFCRLAEGAADLYPRFSPTSEWDTAAAHAVLVAAGGRVDTVDGQSLTYGKAGFKNPAFIARGRT